MGGPIDFTSWIAGWTALGGVVAYGIFIVSRATRVAKARSGIDTRILVTGTRGKSGSVRLIHQVLRATDQPSYGKVTGTTAVELMPDGREVPTVRWAAAGVSEMPDAVIRAREAGATAGVFECMAITPELIRLVQDKYVQAQIVAIPTIRLDHLEEEGLTEFEIGKNILDSISGCDHVVTAIDQPDLLTYYREYCALQGITFTHVQATTDTPVVPGHHPTNVELALAVANLLGVDRDAAIRSFQDVSIEPRALSLQSITLDDGFELGLVDIGGANDPQSAYEALESWNLGDTVTVPIVVNRWERPLRSVVFMSAVVGRFPLIGISGTLYQWAKRVHGSDLDRDRRPHEVGTLFRLSRSMAKDPARIVDIVRAEPAFTAPHHAIVLLMENTHEPTTDLLRETFATKGREVVFSEWVSTR